MANNDNEPQKSEYKNSRGIPWSDVPLRDLPKYIQDGKEAAALLEAWEKAGRP